ncbi:MAG TPA: dihydrolipoyllysine-residue acetyltransferase [Leptospiraceae bacterium]|nr:dihydrolipoyllysine-residue acetyltransferase [Leptospiraceae bacterium]HMW58974.1 dihydrolipoyllysine-residue acetyltransferase [Leptospiraceae bacterium]HMX57004.1 dihydrolipoyllysine-residue acetyltransferase [Leptospiraceae bacterium]HNN73015.1 dihydrolipoyllysine-residue acetyltransferase [Leptospiraceae bacterium]
MGQMIEIKVPDIGNYHDIPVIDVCVKPGDTIAVDAALVTLESDKATMDVPSSTAGTVREIKVKLGDRVSEGTVVAIIEASDSASQALREGSSASATASSATTASASAAASATSGSAQSASSAGASASTANASSPSAGPRATQSPGAPFTLSGKAHASPSVRFFARELGVDLSKVHATGPKDRILKEDVMAYVKGVMTSGGMGGGLDLLPWPKVDFTKFGPIETKPLSKIKKISGQNLSRNWVMIPHVTYHEEADITELEEFRVATNKENAATGVKVTVLAFLIKASAMALKKHPEFNSSIDGDNIVFKHYFHIGFAADTPAGLVVPVIRNVDQKSVTEIAAETSVLAKKAREGKLTPAEMSGACFTISSLGGIGGTSFSPIINAPEVAILGVSKSAMKPVWNGKEFIPRLMLPLSLAADHRIIDGALATHFNVLIASLLSDVRRLVL